ncbi:MAG TPA: hypothetical protein VGF32_32765 [Streptosporangiaceae bacterium]
MKNAKNTLLATLLILGIGDLAMVPFMIAASHRTAGTPPMPAIAAGALIGLATLASLPGVRQDRRWAFRVSMTCRVLDAVSSALGILAGPGVGFAVVGGFGVALSVLAIVLLVRLNPARAPRRAATSA